MGIQVLIKKPLWFLGVLLINIYRPAFAHQDLIPIHTQIAMQISPFFKFNENLSANTYCIYTNTDRQLNEEKAQRVAKEILPAINLKIYKSIKLLSNDCNYLLIDTDNQSDLLGVSAELQNKSLLIGYGANSIHYGYDVSLIKNGNHIEINLNLRSIRTKKITPSAQLIKLSRVLIK